MAKPMPRLSSSRHSAPFLIAAVCTAQTLAQLGAFTFAALLPVFFREWGLSHTEAGWLSGIIFGAYAVAVVFILPVTDRIDPRRVYMAAVALTTVSHLGMALIAEGFWTGLLFRTMAGVGWAGTYMVGLKALADLIEGPAQSRAVAFHAASIGAGGSLSFVLAGAAARWFDWHGAFLISAAGSFCAMLVMALLVPAAARREAAPETRLMDFGPVFRNRSAMAYAIGYCVHTWEMFTVRSWVVTFLVFTLAQTGDRPDFFIPTVVAMLMELFGTASSVFGNEMAIRFGRKRWILGVMLASMLAAAVVGFMAGIGYGAATAVCLVYNILIYADSSSLTAGTVGSAAPGKRGATLAVHATLGYTGGFVGPLVLGVLLDLLGGETVRNWGLAFGHLAAIMLVGPLALTILKPKDLAGDRGRASAE
jgi:MFS family permease